MKHLTYLAVDFCCIFVPFLASFHPKLRFYKEWKHFFIANLIVGVAFLIWDAFFTYLGVWGFNPDYLVGVYCFNLPIEEILFFLCIPYACVFTYFVLKLYIKKHFFQRYHRVISIGLVLLLAAIAMMHYDAKYTFSTASLCALFLLYNLLKREDLSNIYLAYCATLPFFFASNGILTGTLLEKPIVWYNNAENLGIRMGTIPVEDLFYGFLLVGLNVYLYEKNATTLS